MPTSINDMSARYCRFHKGGVTLNVKKCSTFTDETGNIGLVVLPGKWKLADFISDEIRDSQPTRNVPEVILFLQLCNIQQRIVQKVACVTAQLNQRLEEVK